MSVRSSKEMQCTCHSRSMLYVALVAATAWSDVLKKFSVVSTPFGSVERTSHPAARPRAARTETARVAAGEGLVARPDSVNSRSHGSERHIQAQRESPRGWEDSTEGG